MDKNIERMKNALYSYHSAVKAARAEIDRNNKNYKPDVAKTENAAILDKLKENLATARNAIMEAQEAGKADIKAWETPDPARITADAELLERDAVTPEQFKGLVQKYQDNSTMLTLLANFAEKKNGGVGGFESVWNYGGKGNAARNSAHYDTTGLPTADAKRASLDNYAAKAMHLANQIATPAFNPADSSYTIGTGADSAFVIAALESFGND